MITFKVDLKPLPLKRPRFFKKFVYDPSKKDKKEWINIAKKYAPEKPLECPLTINLQFYFKRPKSHYRTGRYSNEMKKSAPKVNTCIPDVDNLSKFVLDAMNAVFYLDDKQVVELNSHKEYINQKDGIPGFTIVTIKPYVQKSNHFSNIYDMIQDDNKNFDDKDEKKNNNIVNMFNTNNTNGINVNDNVFEI